MSTKFVKPELAYKYILEHDTGLNKLMHPILQITACQKVDGVHAKISADQLPCTKLLFTDEHIVLSSHNNASICYPIDLSQEAWQKFLVQECGPEYVAYLIDLENARHEKELDRLNALNNAAEVSQ